jgi:hypothetical protein
MRNHVIVVCLALSASVAHAGQEADAQGPVRMTPSQIAAYNSSLEPTDPVYIKCVRTEAPGSLVPRRVCRTQQDWESRASAAQREARDIVDSIQTRGSTHGQEPPGTIIPVGG